MRTNISCKTNHYLTFFWQNPLKKTTKDYLFSLYWTRFRQLGAVNFVKNNDMLFHQMKIQLQYNHYQHITETKSQGSRTRHVGLGQNTGTILPILPVLRPRSTVEHTVLHITQYYCQRYAVLKHLRMVERITPSTAIVVACVESYLKAYVTAVLLSFIQYGSTYRYVQVLLFFIHLYPTYALYHTYCCNNIKTTNCSVVYALNRI